MTISRTDMVVDELVAMAEALKTPDCIKAYAIWRDFDGDIHAGDFSMKSSDRSAAIALFCEIVEGYEIDDTRQIFVLSP